MFCDVPFPRFAVKLAEGSAPPRTEDLIEDIIRAVLDSNDYDVRLNVTKLDEGKISFSELRATGGETKSPKWLQLRANMFGRRVCTLRV